MTHDEKAYRDSPMFLAYAAQWEAIFAQGGALEGTTPEEMPEDLVESLIRECEAAMETYRVGYHGTLRLLGLGQKVSMIRHKVISAVLGTRPIQDYYRQPIIAPLQEGMDDAHQGREPEVIPRASWAREKIFEGWNSDDEP